MSHIESIFMLLEDFSPRARRISNRGMFSRYFRKNPANKKCRKRVSLLLFIERKKKKIARSFQLR